MVNTVGTQSSIVSGVNALVQLTNGSSTNQYAVVKNFSARWGNSQRAMPVTGTDIPILDMFKFHGEGTMDVIFSTEDTAAKEQFAALLVPVKGEIQPLTVLWQGSDIQNNTDMFSSVITPKQATWSAAGPALTRASLSFLVGGRPSVTFTGAGPGPVPINTVITSSYLGTNEQRYVVWSSGLWWVFYGTASGISYRTASDGMTWSTPTAISSNGTGGVFSLWQAGTTIYYAAATAGAANSFNYRYGTMKGDGTITWLIAEGNHAASPAGNISICLDTAGNIWVAVMVVSAPSSVQVYVFNGSTWSESTGFSVVGSFQLGIAILPLLSGDMILFYDNNAPGTVDVKTFNGSTWSAASPTTNSYNGEAWGVVAAGNVAYFVGVNHSTHHAEFLSYTLGTGFSSATVLSNTAIFAGGSITINGNNLVAFYGLNTDVYAMASANLGSSWAAETHPVTGQSNIQVITSMFSTPTDGYGVLLAEGVSSPYTIKLVAIAV